MSADDENWGRVEHVCTWRAHQKAVTKLTFTIVENRLASVSTDKTVRFWSLETSHEHFINHGHPKLLQIFEDQYPISTIVTVPAFPQMFIYTNTSGQIRVGDTAEEATVQRLSVSEEIR